MAVVAGLQHADEIAVGADDAHLPVRAAEAVGVVRAAPELVAVPLRPFRAVGGAGVDMLCRRARKPVLVQKTLSIPDTALQVKLPVESQLARGHVHPGVAGKGAVRCAQRGRWLDAERNEEAGCQVRDRVGAGQLGDKLREHVSRGARVAEGRARFVEEGRAEKSLGNAAVDVP